MNEIILEIDRPNSNFNLTDGARLDCLGNVPGVYIWLMRTRDRTYLPTYVGETKELKNRFKDHIYNLIVGQYWHVYSENADEYYENIRRIDKGYDDWEKLIGENQSIIEANYGSHEMSRSLDLELIARRIKFFEKQKVISFTFTGIEDSALRKQVESYLIVYFNKLIFERYSFLKSKNKKFKIVNFDLKGKKSNESILGSISKYHSEDIKITNLSVVLKELSIHTDNLIKQVA